MAAIEEKRLPNGVKYLWEVKNGDRPAPKGTVEIGIWPRPDQLVAMRVEAALANPSVSPEPQPEEAPKSPLELARERFHALTRGTVPYDGDALDGAWGEFSDQIHANLSSNPILRFMEIGEGAIDAHQIAVANNDSERANAYGRLRAAANYMVEQYIS